MATILACSAAPHAPCRRQPTAAPRRTPAPRAPRAAPSRCARIAAAAAPAGDEAKGSPSFASTLSEVAEHDMLIDKLLVADGVAQVSCVHGQFFCGAASPAAPPLTNPALVSPVTKK